MAINVRDEHVPSVGLLALAFLSAREVVHRGGLERLARTPRHAIVASVAPLVRIATVTEIAAERARHGLVQLDDHLALGLGVRVVEAAVEVVEPLDEGGLEAATRRIAARHSHRPEARTHRVVQQTAREVDRAAGGVARDPLTPPRVRLALGQIGGLVVVDRSLLDRLLQGVVVEEDRVLEASLGRPRQPIVVGGRVGLLVLARREAERLRR